MKRYLVLAAVALAACNPTDDDERFEAQLTGAAQVPPVQTSATGSAFFTVEGDEIDYSVGARAIQGAVAAHIHAGVPGQIGPPVVSLFQQAAPGVSLEAGSLASGSIDASDMIAGSGVSYDSLLSLLRGGNAYVNVRTVARPGGEIRGQIVRD